MCWCAGVMRKTQPIVEATYSELYSAVITRAQAKKIRICDPLIIHKVHLPLFRFGTMSTILSNIDSYENIMWNGNLFITTGLLL